MLNLAREVITWGLAYGQHVVVMFYWVWIPGFLAIALLSSRYRPLLRQVILTRREGSAAFWAAVGWGMTSGAGRRANLETTRRLWSAGFPEPIVLVHMVASHNMRLYSLLLLTVLLGLEFGLGLFLGGLVMASLLHLILSVLPPGQSVPPDPANIPGQPLATWKTLLCSGRGWRRVLGDIGGYWRNVGFSLLRGLILGALVLVIDTRGFWFFPNWMGDETIEAALASAFLAPILSVVLFLAPGGNLIVVSSLWKTWTLTYNGVISFVLMSLLNPVTARALVYHYGSRQSWVIMLAIYMSAALSGLAVVGLLAVLGVPVTHVPWFRDLVDRIIMALPFTMLGTPAGAPMGGMQGM